MNKHAIRLFCAALGLALGLVFSVGAAAPTLAPAWKLQTPGGSTVSFPDDAKNKPTVLLFWPSWCPFSRALQPYVQDIWEDYGERINVWTINILEKRDPVAVMQERDLSFPLLINGDALMAPYKIKRTPWLLVIDGDRRIVYTRPAKPGSPVVVAQKSRQALNQLLGANAVALPDSYPKPYDLHLKGHSSKIERPTPPAPTPEQWGPWARQYLANIDTDQKLAGETARGPVPDGKTAIRHAREVWTARYGKDTVRAQAPHRAYRINNRWIVTGTPNSGKLGGGLILVITAEDGHIQHIANGA